MTKRGMLQLAAMGVVTVAFCVLAAGYIGRLSAARDGTFTGRARIVRDLAASEKIVVLTEPDAAAAKMAGSLAGGEAVEVLEYAPAASEQYAATARFDTVRFRGLGGAPGTRTPKYSYVLVDKRDIESTAEAVVGVAVWGADGERAKFFKGVVGPVDYLPHVAKKIDKWAKVRADAGFEGWLPAFAVARQE